MGTGVRVNVRVCVMVSVYMRVCVMQCIDAEGAWQVHMRINVSGDASQKPGKLLCGTNRPVPPPPVHMRASYLFGPAK